MSEAKERHHLFKGISAEYESIRVRVREDHDYPLGKIKQVMRNIYYSEDLANKPSRAASGIGASRDFGMSVVSSSKANKNKVSHVTCRKCNRKGHYSYRENDEEEENKLTVLVTVVVRGVRCIKQSRRAMKSAELRNGIRSKPTQPLLMIKSTLQALQESSNIRSGITSHQQKVTARP